MNCGARNDGRIECHLSPFNFCDADVAPCPIQQGHVRATRERSRSGPWISCRELAHCAQLQRLPVSLNPLPPAPAPAASTAFQPSDPMIRPVGIERVDHRRTSRSHRRRRRPSALTIVGICAIPDRAPTPKSLPMSSSANLAGRIPKLLRQPNRPPPPRHEHLCAPHGARGRP